MSEPKTLLPQFTALAIGLAGGVMAYFAGLPLPWMLGPMIANTAAAMLRAPTVGPDQLRPFVIPVIGVMLGSGVTAEIFGLLGTWVLTLLLLPVFLACAAGISYAVYRRIGKYDPVTAFYSAMPGGLNEMLILGGEAGGDERRIALAHAARVLIIIIFVALFFGLILGVSSGGRGTVQWIGLYEITMLDYAILGFCAVAGALLGRWIGLPAAPVFGPMILSGIAHIAGWVTVAPPTIFVIAAQITIGTIIGTRFIGATLAEIRTDIGLSAVASTLMLIAAVGFAELIVLISGIPLAQAFLAFSPGGLTEMSLLTLAMEQDVTYVSIMHIIRITLVIALAPFVFKLIRKRRD
ncbi:AbrB family transcriptional regulator [Roseobacter sp. CCS2]|uniref:AbrB family transcriptional regulator n=1 Tax=Roseobacter sp. CCS2 TaxID=391593 RepID=UPI0000F40445|nr:AbrB family transcriptional regulator [Roseobacter sp. CCS2]EBA13804.1 Putative ammonia monooxygenase [Roseobacter sp. CCS2]